MLEQDELIALTLALYYAGFNGNFLLKAAQNESSPPAPAPAPSRARDRARAEIPRPQSVGVAYFNVLTSANWCGVLKYAKLPNDILVLLLEHPETGWFVENYPDANWGVLNDTIDRSGWNLFPGLPQKHVRTLLSLLEELCTIQITPSDQDSWNRTLAFCRVRNREFLHLLRWMSLEDISDMFPCAGWFDLCEEFEKTSLFQKMPDGVRREILRKLNHLIVFEYERNQREIMNLESCVERRNEVFGLIELVMQTDELETVFKRLDFLVNWFEVRSVVKSTFREFSRREELEDKLNQLCSMEVSPLEISENRWSDVLQKCDVPNINILLDLMESPEDIHIKYADVDWTTLLQHFQELHENLFPRMSREVRMKVVRKFVDFNEQA
jgi:hypothetical protein